MAGITYLNLPIIEPGLTQKLIEEGLKIPNYTMPGNFEAQLHGRPGITNSNTDNWGASLKQNYRGEVADGSIYKLPQQCVDDLIEQFQPYFKHDIFPTLVKFHNNTGEPMGDCGPHCDAWRTVGINYHLQLGGENVITCSYAQTRKDWSNLLTDGENAKYNDVDLLCEHHVPANTWHVLDVQRYHAVHNVEHDRIFVSLAYAEQIPYRDFLKQYSDLII